MFLKSLCVSLKSRWPLVDEDSHLSLRPVTDEDLDCLAWWFRDLELVRFAFGYENVSEQDLSGTARDYCDRIRRYKNNSLAIVDSEGEAIGIIRFDLRGSKEGEVALVGIMLGTPQNRGRGLGSIALRLLLKYLFETVKVASVEMETATYNKAAIHSFDKVGFERCPRLISLDGLEPNWRDQLGAPKVWFRYSKDKWFAQNKA